MGLEAILGHASRAAYAIKEFYMNFYATYSPLATYGALIVTGAAVAAATILGARIIIGFVEPITKYFGAKPKKEAKPG
ncbi:MAG TPA: hypothetical protein VFF28_00675 [Candidatus Nanoarchaeia archaeon]|nr:hypothetical protein [Candidatus Nanoarchaeia archaeon]